MDSRVLPTPENRPGNAVGALRRLFRLVRPYKATLCVLLAVAVAAIALDIYMPVLIERCIDAIAGRGAFAVDVHGFFDSFIRLAVVIAAGALLGWLHGFLSSRLSQTVAADLREALFRKILRVPLSVSDQYASGDLMSRIVNDSELAASAFSEVLLSLLSDGLVIVGCAAVMFWRDVFLAGVTVGATAFAVLLTALVSRVLFPAFFAQQTALGALNAHIEESVHAFRSCVTGGRKAENQRLLRQYNREYYAKNIRAAKLEGIMEPLMLLLGNVNFLLIIVFGAKRVMAGAVSLGLLQAFVLYARQFMEPVTELGGCFAKAQSALAAAERIFTLLDRPDEPDAPALPAAAACVDDGAHLRLENVSFAYRRSRTVLHDVSFRVEKGDRLAVAGVTGAGKTTLVSLLLRLYDQYTGNIYLSGVDIRQIGLRELRERITLVPQEPQIITGTVFENLTYGAPDATREQVLEAARAVGLDAVIQALPLRYETPLRSDTATLSQGQLQLICLARALLRNAELLIMDESTSSVDAAMEEALTRGMQTVMQGKTCILIAHRITSVPNAGHICVVEDGRIAKFVANDRQRFRQSGFYRELLANQMLE